MQFMWRVARWGIRDLWWGSVGERGWIVESGGEGMAERIRQRIGWFLPSFVYWGDSGLWRVSGKGEGRGEKECLFS